jgi:hypothetical protein
MSSGVSAGLQAAIKGHIVTPAFVHRRPLFCIQYYGTGSTAARIDQAWRAIGR